MAICGRGAGGRRVDFLFFWNPLNRIRSLGSLYISGKLLTSHLRQNVSLGEGLVGSFPETYNDLLFASLTLTVTLWRRGIFYFSLTPE